MTDGSEALITAMHTAGGSTPRPVSEWLALAQEHAALRDAFRAAFGKKLPVPQKLGLWLSERTGKTAGPLRLEGRHSAKRKAWVYRVVDYVKLAELARQEAERQAQLRAELEAKQRELIAASPLASAQAYMTPGHFTAVKDTPTPEYLYEPVKYVDGVEQPRKVLIDPRTGEPVRKKPAAVVEKLPDELGEVEAAPKSNDPRPPWLQRGESIPRDNAEWLAWQRRRNPRDSVDAVLLREDYDNGVDFYAGPNGVRVFRTEGHDAWRYGGPHWRQKL
jgi:hypothetical protein